MKFPKPEKKFWIVFTHHKRMHEQTFGTLPEAFAHAKKMSDNHTGCFYVAEVLGVFETTATETATNIVTY